MFSAVKNNMFSESKSHNVKQLLEKPTFLDSEVEEDVLVFRRTIEAAMKLGYWGGFCGSA